MKRSKNIFNSMIAPQNLLESEGNRQNKIGDLLINSNWLKGVRSQQYRPYIISALKLSQLQKELDDLKEDQVSSPTKQSNLFKVGKTKKKIDQLALQSADDNKPLEQYLAKNQPPETQDLILQKMSQGFFKSLLQRKCKISEKELYIESLKDENNKWIKIGILGYNLELEEQEKPLNKPEFTEYKWISGYKQRILLWAPDMKNYCLYGKLDQLKKFQRYFQVQNIQVKQLNVFKSLEAQLKQKIIVYFGKKVRFYDYSLRVRKNQKDAQLDTYADQEEPEKKKVAQKTKEEKQREKSSEVGQSSQLGHSSQFSQSGLLQSQFLNTVAKTAQKGGTGSVVLDVSKSQKKQKKQKQKTRDGQIFKLKLKSSIIFYNQIKEPIQFKDEQYKVQDLKLNLREQIGISDVDEESQSRSGASFSKGRDSSKKKVKRLTVRNVLDNEEKFSINIYEASSQKKIHSSQKKQNQFDLDVPSLGHSSSGNLSQFIQAKHRSGTPKSGETGKLNLSEFGNISGMYKSKQINQFQGSDYFQLQKARPPDEIFDKDFDRALTPIHSLEREISKLKSQKKIGEIDVYQSSNKQEIYCTVSFIEMFVPYHSDQLEFQILQIDPQIQMQGKLVTCGRVKQTLKEKKTDNQKYTLYQNQGGSHFRFSKASNRFIFVLVQETKCHYIPFEIDANLKYKKNESQLLISQLDHQGYPFAACLGLYASPHPIKIGPRLKTAEFMQKYLNEGENYDFKHDFINDKKRLQMIRKEWNKKVSKNALRQGDAQAFGKAVFLGLSDSIFKSLKKKVTYDSRRLFSFTDNQYRLIEENVVTGLIDLKSFLKPLFLIKLIAQGVYNDFMKQRLQHVYVYFLNRYGSVRNLALVFVKEILEKLEPILISCRKEEQVCAVLKLYFQVQFEIDELFLKISSYFKK